MSSHVRKQEITCNYIEALVNEASVARWAAANMHHRRFERLGPGQQGFLYGLFSSVRPTDPRTGGIGRSSWFWRPDPSAIGAMVAQEIGQEHWPRTLAKNIGWARGANFLWGQGTREGVLNRCRGDPNQRHSQSVSIRSGWWFAFNQMRRRSHILHHRR